MVTIVSIQAQTSQEATGIQEANLREKQGQKLQISNHQEKKQNGFLSDTIQEEQKTEPLSDTSLKKFNQSNKKIK